MTPIGYSSPVGYSRSSFTWRNVMTRPLDDDDARSLIAKPIKIQIGETVTAIGTVTNARILDDGARIMVTTEVGGRWCEACGHVYPPGSEHLMGTVEKLQEQMPTIYTSPLYEDLTPWTLICRDSATCLFRRMEP